MHISHLLNDPAAVSAAQQTPQWLQQRIGKLTGSKMAAAMSFRKDGSETAERARLKIEIVAERLTDIFVPHYVTDAMQWGIDTEAEAKLAARQLIGIDIKECGFYDHPTIDMFGATPDGLIEDDGLIEIKCPTTPTHIQWLLNDQVPPEYKPQMIAQLLCTGRRYCQFMSYDPRVVSRPLLYKRYAPSQEERDKVEQAAIRFLREVEQLFERVTSTVVT